VNPPPANMPVMQLPRAAVEKRVKGSPEMCENPGVIPIWK